jgi:hypothetical protein
MATKKRSTGRAKSTTRPRAAGRNAKPVAKPKRTTKTLAAKSAKPARGDKPKQAAAPKRAAAAESRELVALKARFQRERSALEKNLTEAVREIGILRHHEMRAMQLERQLKERDDLIGRLQQQLEELQRRPLEPIYEREVQQSFALVAPARDDLDEFQDDAQLVDESELEDEEA